MRKFKAKGTSLGSSPQEPTPPCILKGPQQQQKKHLGSLCGNNVSTDHLTSDSDTNIFKAPEAMREMTPEMNTFEDNSAEPETPPVQGTCHHRTRMKEESTRLQHLKLFSLIFFLTHICKYTNIFKSAEVPVRSI